MDNEQRAALRKLAEKSTPNGWHKETIISLLDYIETLEKDAGRYRWLRDPTVPIASIIDKQVENGIYEYRAGDELDASIDAAMQGETE